MATTPGKQASEPTSEPANRSYASRRSVQRHGAIISYYNGTQGAPTTGRLSLPRQDMTEVGKCIGTFGIVGTDDTDDTDTR